MAPFALRLRLVSIAVGVLLASVCAARMVPSNRWILAIPTASGLVAVDVASPTLMVAELVEGVCARCGVCCCEIGCVDEEGHSEVDADGGCGDGTQRQCESAKAHTDSTQSDADIPSVSLEKKRFTWTRPVRSAEVVQTETQTQSPMSPRSLPGFTFPSRKGSTSAGASTRVSSGRGVGSTAGSSSVVVSSSTGRESAADPTTTEGSSIMVDSSTTAGTTTTPYLSTTLEPSSISSATPASPTSHHRNVTVDGSTYTHSKLPGSTVGGITVGVVVGIAAISLLLFLLYKWYEKLQAKKNSGRGGLLPGPRRETPSYGDNIQSSSDRYAITHSALTTDDPRTPSRCGSLASPDCSPEPYHAYSTERAEPSPPPKTAHIAEPKLLPKLELDSGDAAFIFPTSSSYSNMPSTPVKGTTDNEIDNASNDQSSDGRNSPPYTPTPTPKSPIFSLYLRPRTTSPSTSVPASPTKRMPTRNENWPFARTHSPLSADVAELPVPDPAKEDARKSSALLPMAGPFLSAEAALGEGFWEAEREQLEADRKMREAEGLSGKSDDGMQSGLATEKNAVGDIEEVEVSETGTVVRRRGLR